LLGDVTSAYTDETEVYADAEAAYADTKLCLNSENYANSVLLAATFSGNAKTT
jgi:hypothetical protein